MSDPKIEYIENLLKANESIDRTIALIELLTIAGEEGIQEIAKQDPEVLLKAFESLVSMMKANQKNSNRVVEMYFELRDEIDKLIETMERKKS